PSIGSLPPWTPTSFVRALPAFVQAALPNLPPQVIALDGKTVCGSHGMRNEVMEELCLDQERESTAKRDATRRGGGKNCGLGSERVKTCTAQRNSQAKRP